MEDREFSTERRNGNTDEPAPPDNKNERSRRRVASLCIILMVYTLLPLLMIPLGLACIARALLGTLEGWRTATDPHEKAYWKWNSAAHLLFAYAIAILVALAIDSLLGEPYKLAEWWPAISRYWSVTTNHTVPVLLDALMALGAAFGALCLSRCFGYVDENDAWHGRRKEHGGPLLFIERRARQRSNASRRDFWS